MNLPAKMRAVEVSKPGGFVIENNEAITVLQVMAMAGGVLARPWVARMRSASRGWMAISRTATLGSLPVKRAQRAPPSCRLP